MKHKLVDMFDGHELTPMEEVTTFRGHKVILTGWAQPGEPDESGRVFVVYHLGDKDELSLYPSAIGACFRITRTS